MVSRTAIFQWLSQIEPSRRDDTSLKHCGYTHSHGRKQHPLSPPASLLLYASDRRTPGHPSASASLRSKPNPERKRQSRSMSSSSRTPNNKRRRLQAAVITRPDPHGEDGQQHTGLSHGDDGDDGYVDDDYMEEVDLTGQDRYGDQVETPRPVRTVGRSININTRLPSSPTKRPRRKPETSHSSVSSSSSALRENGDEGNSVSNTSRQSGALSPTKKMAAMELNPDGLETRPFSLDDPRMPQSLADLLVEMEAYGNGEHVLSWSQRVSYPLLTLSLSLSLPPH